MTDYFALLGVPRHPWLEEKEVKKKFLELTSQTHPDRVHGETDDGGLVTGRSAEINSAYSCLREPKTRLLHLLELESGARPTDLQNVPAEMSEFFLTISSLNREVDALLKQKQTTTSPLLKLQSFEKSHGFVDRLQVLLKEVETRNAQLVNQLKEADDEWAVPNRSSEAKAELVLRLENLYRLFGFHARWAASLRDRITRLSFNE